jgi:hypothetical protein
VELSGLRSAKRNDRHVSFQLLMIYSIHSTPPHDLSLTTHLLAWCAVLMICLHVWNSRQTILQIYTVLFFYCCCLFTAAALYSQLQLTNTNSFA